MSELKIVFFSIGTLAFFATVYLAIQNPDLVESPLGEPPRETTDNPLRKWDHVISWVMWGGWGLTALLAFLDKNGYSDLMES